MLPDPGAVFARRAAALLPVELGEEERAALRDAAELAGDPGLVPALEALVVAYRREKAADPPTRGQLHHQLRDVARLAAQLRRAVTVSPWRRTAIANVREPVRLDFAQLELLLGGLERRARMGALEHAPGDRASADRSPASPRWRALWALAALWADRGGYVGLGPSARFPRFARATFGAVGEALADRELTDLARCWQAPGSAMVTREPRKSAVASSES